MDLVRNGGLWIWSRFSCPSVPACVRDHISDLYGPILFIFGKKTTHYGIHIYARNFFFRYQIPVGQLAAILLVKNRMLNTSSTISRTCIHRCCLNLANREGMMEYLCMSFFSRLVPRWPTGGHFSCKNPDVEHVLNHFSDMHLSMLFKLGRQITNDGLQMDVIFFSEIRSKMAD